MGAVPPIPTIPSPPLQLPLPLPPVRPTPHPPPVPVATLRTSGVWRSLTPTMRAQVRSALCAILGEVTGHDPEQR